MKVRDVYEPRIGEAFSPGRIGDHKRGDHRGLIVLAILTTEVQQMKHTRGLGIFLAQRESPLMDVVS